MTRDRTNDPAPRPATPDGPGLPQLVTVAAVAAQLVASRACSSRSLEQRSQRRGAPPDREGGPIAERRKNVGG